MTVYTIRNKNIDDLSFLKEGTFVYDPENTQGFILNNTDLLIHDGVPLTYDQLAYGVFRNDIVSVTPDKIAKTIFKKDFILTPSYTVDEASSIGTVVGTFTKVIDIATYTYSINTFSDTFEVVGTELRTKAALNYQQNSNYSIEIKIQDNFDSARFWIETITIDVLGTVIRLDIVNIPDSITTLCMTPHAQTKTLVSCLDSNEQVGVLLDTGDNSWVFGTHPITGMEIIKNTVHHNVGGIELLSLIQTSVMGGWDRRTIWPNPYSALLNIRIVDWFGEKYILSTDAWGGDIAVGSEENLILTAFGNRHLISIKKYIKNKNINEWFQLGVHKKHNLEGGEFYITINGEVVFMLLSSQLNLEFQSINFSKFFRAPNYDGGSPRGEFGIFRYAPGPYSKAQMKSFLQSDLGQ